MGHVTRTESVALCRAVLAWARPEPGAESAGLLARLFAHESFLQPYFAFLFSDLSSLLANEPRLQPDEPFLLSDQSSVFSNFAFLLGEPSLSSSLPFFPSCPSLLTTPSSLSLSLSADLPSIFSDLASILANEPLVQSDVASVQPCERRPSDVTAVQPDQPELFANL